MKLTYILVFILGLISGITINQITKPAQAEIAGMDTYDLKYGYDFKKAVKSIVEDYQVINGVIIC